MGELSFSQVKTNHSLTKSKKSVKMDTLKIQTENKETVYFIDKFFVPKNSIEEFTRRMNYNRGFIKNLDGFIKDEIYEQKDEEGNLTIITIAAWQSQEDLNNAKSIVQDEYKRIDFNPTEFTKRLNIKMERGIYTYRKEQ
jgi:predicted transcriptional regulator